MKDIHTDLKVERLIAPAVLTDDNTLLSVDRLGYEAVEIILDIGAGGITFTGTNKIEFKLTHSDLPSSGFVAVTKDDLIGVSSVGTGGIIKALTAAKPAASLDTYGYIGGKRYLRLLADFGGTHATGTQIAAYAEMRHGHIQQKRVV